MNLFSKKKKKSIKIWGWDGKKNKNSTCFYSYRAGSIFPIKTEIPAGFSLSLSSHGGNVPGFMFYLFPAWLGLFPAMALFQIHFPLFLCVESGCADLSILPQYPVLPRSYSWRLH